ncbi:MAG: hypothetical protein R3F44_07455 [Candidatus Competibacteraceae bacterium]
MAGSTCTFARQIRLFEVGGRHTLLDVSPTVHRNAEGGRIAGWLWQSTGGSVTGYPKYPLARPSIKDAAARRASLVT